jgi:hypothetical protein
VREYWCDAKALLKENLYDESRIAASMALLETAALVQTHQNVTTQAPNLYAEWVDRFTTSQISVSRLNAEQLSSISSEIEKWRFEIEQVHWQRLERAVPYGFHKELSNDSRLHRSALLNVVQVSPTVWFGGSIRDTVTLHLLQGAGVSTIMFVAEEEQSFHDHLSSLNILRLPIKDTALSYSALKRIESRINELCDNLDNKSGAVFVSCNFGIDRSALVAALLISRQEHIPKPLAAQKIRRCRRDALQNSSFWEFLQAEY